MLVLLLLLLLLLLLTAKCPNRASVERKVREGTAREHRHEG
jgi:hypothetical protein